MAVESNYVIAIATRVIGLKVSSSSFLANRKQNQNQSHIVRGNFFRALSKLQVIARNSDWFIALFAPVVIGRSNNFGFGFTTII